MKIETTRGTFDDSELEKTVEALDEPTRFAHRLTFRLRGMETAELVARANRLIAALPGGNPGLALSDWETFLAESIAREKAKAEAGVLAVYEVKLFDKVNPFVDPENGRVNVDFGDERGIFEMDVAELDKRDIVIDNATEYTWVREYRLKGTDKIVHRSPNIKLKQATVTGQAVAATL